MIIEKIKAREILDSRGNPTVEAEVVLANGVRGRASVPSGASTGAYEAVELRDCDVNRYLGMGVKNAVENVNNILAPSLVRKSVYEQRAIDCIMCKTDGTHNKGGMGANAILAVSLACAHCAANALRQPLYRYLGGSNAHVLPVPMMNVINGGKHADNSLNLQEFMIIPVGATSFSQGLMWGAQVFHTLKNILKKNKYSTAVGDEGGYAPNLGNDEEALQLLTDAIREAGFVPGKDFMLAIDAAATELYDEAEKSGQKGCYYFWKTGEIRSRVEMVHYWEDLVSRYPILSLEDGLAEEDFEGTALLTEKLGDSLQLVGDDLFVTNVNRIRQGQRMSAANAVLIKPNQIGSLSETMDAVSMTMKHGWCAIISHRSGETEDTTIADLAVATGAGQIKTGAPSRTDRVAKYNRLLRIEEELGEAAVYSGWDAFGKVQSPWKFESATSASRVESLSKDEELFKLGDNNRS